MMSEYRKEERLLGHNIDDTVEFLQTEHTKGNKVQVDFNGHTLYSDTVTLDDAYVTITGMTFQKFREAIEEKRLIREKQEQEHIAKIPELTEYWIREGKKIIPEEKHEMWEQCVPVRLADLYQGAEIKQCLDVIRIIKPGTGISFDMGRKELNHQGHSGMSYSLVCSMILEFSERGPQFIK